MTTPSYRTAVASVFAGLSAEPLFNGSIEHACLIMEEGFKAGSREILLLTHRLDSRCYEQPAVLAAARQFLARGDTHLRILLEDASALEDVDRILREFADAGGDRVSVKVVRPDVVADYNYNFMVVDDKGYRFEADRREHAAVVAGGPENITETRHLREIFAVIDRLSVDLELQQAA